MTYFWKRGILDPIKARDNLMVIREALITPHQNLLTVVSVGSIASNPKVNSGETGERQSRG